MVALRLLAASFVGYAAADFFVSPDGDDSGPGTASAPWKTLSRAQTGVRAVAPTMKEDIVVFLQPGGYPQSSTLAFTELDSGANGFTVRWRSSEPGAALVHGGVTVTGWSAVGGGSPAWVADFPSGVSEARQLYVSNQRALPTVLGAGLPGAVQQTAWGYTTTDSTPLAWASASAQPGGTGIEFIYTGVGS
jgi:hypothetical protein